MDDGTVLAGRRRSLPASLSSHLQRLASAPIRVVFLALCMVVLAVVARSPGLDLFPTQDEDNWLDRSAAFRAALQRQDWRATYRSGHPGVTTMWLASAGMGGQSDALAGRSERLVTRVPQFMEALESARHALVVLNSLLIAIIVLLAGRLLGWMPAAIGGGLLAFEPFLVAHGQVVHLDAPVSGLMAVSMLAAMNRWLAHGSAGFLALSAVAGGLAFINKSPSAFLVLAIPLIALVGAWQDARRGTQADPPPAAASRPASMVRRFGALAIWFVLAGATAMLAWPALLTAPAETIGRMVRFTLAEGGQPHGPGNFFLGEPVAVPGPLFYPVTLAFRLAPATLAGLGCLALLSWWQPRFKLPAPSVLLLIVLAFGFIGFMTLGAKRLDRYVLPAVPLLGILAGVGLWAATVDLARRMRGSGLTSRLAPAVLPVGILLLQPMAWLSALPYPLSYYSPLFGGGTTAERTILVGWGEGLDQAAAYLNAQPGAESSTIAVYFPLTVNFQALVRGTVVSYGSRVEPTYVVDYLNARQRGQVPASIQGRTPEHVVRINGIEYARVYRVT